jgi:hypothetical protein
VSFVRPEEKRSLSLEELPLVLPPAFAEACGYRGNARYVALCWTSERFELLWSDNGHAVVGYPDAFLTLCTHPATEAALEPFHRAISRDVSRPWLLIDRDRRRISFGNAAEVWRVLDEQSCGPSNSVQRG